VLALALAITACGAKSGLLAAHEDAAVEAGPADVASEPPPPPEPPDASADVADEPPAPQICDDAGPTLIHVVTSQSLLYRFDPANAKFISVGTIFCGSAASPFSMAVTRNGTAYVLFNNGYLYEVNTQNAACKPTSFVPLQLGWSLFGMGFVSDPGGASDTLYVSEGNYTHPSLGLAKLDTSSLKLSFIAPFSESPGHAVELTGTGDGRLYAFGLPTEHKPTATVAEVDEATGTLLSTVQLSVGEPNSSFAFAFWGGDFYLFTAPEPGASSEVTRYRPSDGSLTKVAKVQATVVGAGVSTCAPF
jgi:hypothetical protein